MKTPEEFVQKHKQYFDRALSEIEAGRKESHWMWYIIPTPPYIGRDGVERGSEKNKEWAIRGAGHLAAYLAVPLLRKHYIDIMKAIARKLEEGVNLIDLIGEVDEAKLWSSLDLFGSSGVHEIEQVCERVVNASCGIGGGGTQRMGGLFSVASGAVRKLKRRTARGLSNKENMYSLILAVKEYIKKDSHFFQLDVSPTGNVFRLFFFDNSNQAQKYYAIYENEQFRFTLRIYDWQATESDEQDTTMVFDSKDLKDLKTKMKEDIALWVAVHGTIDSESETYSDSDPSTAEYV